METGESGESDELELVSVTLQSDEVLSLAPAGQSDALRKQIMLTLEWEKHKYNY